MFYTKLLGTKVPLDEGIFTECYVCDKEISVTGEVMKKVLTQGNIAISRIVCKECARDKNPDEIF